MCQDIEPMLHDHAPILRIDWLLDKHKTADDIFGASKTARSQRYPLVLTNTAFGCISNKKFISQGPSLKKTDPPAFPVRKQWKITFFLFARRKPIVRSFRTFLGCPYPIPFHVSSAISVFHLLLDLNLPRPQHHSPDKDQVSPHGGGNPPLTKWGGTGVPVSPPSVSQISPTSCTAGGHLLECHIASAHSNCKTFQTHLDLVRSGMPCWGPLLGQQAHGQRACIYYTHTFLLQNDEEEPVDTWTDIH